MSVTFGPKQGLIISAATGDVHDVALRALLRALDQELFLSVKNRTTTAPPGSPTNGDAYIVATGGSGAWSGHDKHVAVWTTDNPITPSGLWEFYVPKAGWLAWSVADVAFYNYTGSAWAAFAGGGGATAFTGLSDVPASYTGQANKVVAVNGGETALVFVTPAGGGGGGMGSLLGMRRFAQWFCKPSNAGTLVVNGEIFTVLGTEVNGRESPDANQGEATSYDNASADTPSGWQGSSSLNWFIGSNLHFFGEAYLATITDILFLAGLLGASNVGGSTPGNGTKGYYFRFDITASDAHIQCVTCDGSAKTVTSSGVVPVAGHSYRLVILVDDVTPAVKFYIDDTLVATNTTNVPPATSSRAIPQISAAWHTGTTSPLLGISQMVVQSDR